MKCINLRFVFNQNIKCKDVDKCCKNIMDKLTNLLETDDLSSFHCSISHKQGDHKIWVFTYDTKGVHESELHGEIKLNKNPDLPIKKFTGKIPSLAQLKSKLV